MARAKISNGNAIPEMRTFKLVYDDKTTKSITVPGSWRATFGPIVMTANGRDRNAHGQTKLLCTAVRFYAGSKDDLRAVFPDVQEFFDQSMLIEPGVAP